MNTIGIVGGFLGPYYIGLAKDLAGLTLILLKVLAANSDSERLALTCGWDDTQGTLSRGRGDVKQQVHERVDPAPKGRSLANFNPPALGMLLATCS